MKLVFAVYYKDHIKHVGLVQSGQQHRM
jgi:hypothetical protein